MRRRDAGSTEIRDLLDRDSERLTQDFVSLLGALKAAPDQKYGVPPQSAFDAIEDIRSAYRELLVQVDAIQTSNPAKSEVIASFGVIDDGFGRFAQGLETGISRRGKKRLRSAEKVLDRAGEDLTNARRRL